MVDGWPGRVARDNWGPTMETEKRQENPLNSLNDKQVNLSFWQDGGMSLVLPKVVMRIVGPGDPPLHISFAAFTWDQAIYLNPSATLPLPPGVSSLVLNGLGDITVTFDNQVLGRPDEDTGAPELETLAFQFGMASINLGVGGQNGRTEFELVDPQTFRVRMFVGVLPSSQSCTVAVW